MSEYLTDEEKAERIKKWWSDNGMSIIAGLVLGVVGLVGWQWWSGREDQRAEVASEMLSAAMASIQAGQYEQADRLLVELDGVASRTPYRSLGYALRAELESRSRLEADEADGERPDPAVTIRQARETAPMDELGQLFALREARLALESGDPEGAERILETVSAIAYGPLVMEIRGDIAFANGDRETARDWYRRALDAGVNYDGVRLKLDAVAS